MPLPPARLRARIEVAEAEVRTLWALPLQPRMQTILAISTTDIKCATTRLESQPDELELEHIGRWLQMIENQLHTVRKAQMPLRQSEAPKSRTA